MKMAIAEIKFQNITQNAKEQNDLHSFYLFIFLILHYATAHNNIFILFQIIFILFLFICHILSKVVNYILHKQK